MWDLAPLQQPSGNRLRYPWPFGERGFPSGQGDIHDGFPQDEAFLRYLQPVTELPAGFPLGM
jgi:hypothetical protein